MKFVFDLDGTVCFKGKPLSEEILTAFQQLESDGHDVVIASARPIRDIYPVLPKHYHQLQMVGGNGAFLFNGEEIRLQPFTEDTQNALFDLVNSHNIPYLLDSSWDYSYNGSEEHPIFNQLDQLELAENLPKEQLEGIVKCVLFTNEQSIIDAISQLECVIHIHSNEAILDISPVGVRKFQGLNELGIKKGQYIAFGNDQNDRQMLQHALESVCVGDDVSIGALATSICEATNVAEKIRLLSSKYKK